MIGILGLQGDVEEHSSYLLSRCRHARSIKRPSDLEGINGLVLPGGESTTISRLIRSSGLEEPVRSLLINGLPAWGTCAGTILLCRGGIWAMVEAEVERNAYGSQANSSVRPGRVRGRDEPVPMVFIRAPRITGVSKNVEILASNGNDIVAVRQGTILLTTFHPELTPGDSFFLQAFLDLVAGSKLIARPDGNSSCQSPAFPGSPLRRG
jgi:pyridoxal 5'-phosphate synthase pdxT subunit